MYQPLQVVQVRNDVPTPLFNFFVNRLVDTIRREESSCFTAAYDDMTMNECKRMLHMDNLRQFKDFARGQEHWKIREDRKTIKFEKEETPLPTRADIWSEMFAYARSLNTII